MRKVKEQGGYVLIEMVRGDKFPGFKGAHVDNYPYANDRILQSCAAGGAGGWSWAALQYYPWDACFAVISKHDYEKLTAEIENEFGIVSP